MILVPYANQDFNV